jgi:hypothetical protein
LPPLEYPATPEFAKPAWFALPVVNVAVKVVIASPGKAILVIPE